MSARRGGGLESDEALVEVRDTVREGIQDREAVVEVSEDVDKLPLIRRLLRVCETECLLQTSMHGHADRADLVGELRRVPDDEPACGGVHLRTARDARGGHWPPADGCRRARDLVD